MSFWQSSSCKKRECMYDDKSDIYNCSGRDSVIDTVSGVEAQWEGRTGFSNQSCRTFAGTVLDRAVYL